MGCKPSTMAAVPQPVSAAAPSANSVKPAPPPSQLSSTSPVPQELKNAATPPAASAQKEAQESSSEPRGKKDEPQNSEVKTIQHLRAKRRQNEFSEPLKFSEDFVIPDYPKSEETIQFIDDCMSDNFIFAGLSKEERRLLILAMEGVSVSAGTIIIQQGDTGDYFYIVEEGHVGYKVDNNHVGACTRGASFGELALLYNCPRAASCVANDDCKVWKVDQRTFRHVLANNQSSQEKDSKDVLRKVSFFSELDDAMLLKIYDALTAISFHAGDRIINKGDVGEVFYILKEGSVKVHDIGGGETQYVDQILGPGDFFGERALRYGEPRAANLTAMTACTTMVLSRESFEKTLGPLQGLIDNAMLKRVLMGVPIFANSQFQPFEMARLADLIEEITFKKGEVLAEDGQLAKQNLYIIQSGKVVVANDNGMINNLTKGDYFGGTHLKEDDAISTQTITVEDEAVCGVLTRFHIESVIGDISRLGKTIPPVTTKLDKSIDFRDLEKYRILGVGTFGKVWLVSHKKSAVPYALKMLNKREIIGHHQVEGVIREKNIMSSIEHPFVVNLMCTFQDDRHLYMLIGLVQGGELFSVIHTETRDGIANTNARFYSACILESLSHLHHRHITYRDLKPENILIDAKGYCVLVDLGFAKIVMDKTYTLCGTPEYLAPEIILSKGHDKGVDYWAFGVLIYEMLVGRSPFYSYGTDQVSLFKRIVQVKYAFPPGGIVNEVAQDVIQRLIVRRQANRFGCLARGDMDIRDHAWFSVISVDSLLKKEVSAPWVPNIKDPLDASHFDSYKHVENEAASTKPQLSASQQDLFQDF